ncbi:uncharacterized protein A4U43_C10F15470 [Asparagus officinalis]|uniref:Uncharacterized protein n=1 Tax=Asparagus officinalis TaxID=4686 RepID=A0A5P1E7S6_ASPOF|nr:uncharacterized protein A4U43_C10F15470 [Asparagus officinalis]
MPPSTPAMNPKMRLRALFLFLSWRRRREFPGRGTSPWRFGLPERSIDTRFRNEERVEGIRPEKKLSLAISEGKAPERRLLGRESSRSSDERPTDAGRDPLSRREGSRIRVVKRTDPRDWHETPGVWQGGRRGSGARGRDYTRRAVESGEWTLSNRNE